MKINKTKIAVLLVDSFIAIVITFTVVTAIYKTIMFFK